MRPESWSLPSFAIRRPVTVLMALLTFSVIGLVSWSRLPLEFIVQLWEPTVWVNIPYPGATPEQVEAEVTIAAEGAFKTLPELKSIQSTSDYGHCGVGLRFGLDTDIGLATAEIRDRIERLRLQLPQEVDHITISRFGPEDIPILRFAILRDYDEDALARYARTGLRSRLMRVEGVAEVNVSGRASEQVYVDFRPDDLESLGLGLQQVAATLQSSSVNLSVGTLDEGGDRHFVRARDEFEDRSDLERAVISPQGLRLRDVADVNERQPPGAERFTVDGKRGVFVRILKEGGANSVEVCARVRDALARIEDDPELAGAQVVVFEDQSEYIQLALDSLFLAGRYGCAMAFVVLWLFLRRFRVTLVVALVIPASLLLAPAYLYFNGKSLNLLSIAAMLISVGILVDNAIVVVENIQRHNALHPGRKDNASRGAAEVALAITAATLTTLVVFVPVFYLDAGEMSSIMREFAGPIACSLLASLVLALTVIPMTEHRFPSRAFAPRSYSGRLGNLRRHLARYSFGVVQDGYARGLGMMLHNRTLTVCALGAAIVGTGLVAVPGTGFKGIPEMDMRTIDVRFIAEPNYGRDEIRAYVEGMAAQIEARKADFGIDHLYVNSGGWGGQITCFLVKESDGTFSAAGAPMTTEEARAAINALFPARLAGARIDCGIPSSNPDSTRSVRVWLRGSDRETLEGLAGNFMARMAELPTLRNIRPGDSAPKDEIQLHIDETRAAAAALNPTAIARTVSFALSGSNLPYLKKDGREVPVRGQLAGEERRDLGDLERINVTGSTGQSVPLLQVADLRHDKTPQRIRRREAQGQVVIEAETEEEDLLAVRKALDELAAGFATPRGYTVELDRSFRNIDEVFIGFRNTLLMSVVLIYLVIAALFESWLLPFSVLTTVPLAFIGIYWSLYFSGTPLDSIALVGSIILCGLIVNNGIVIVDHINGLRREGVPRTDAILQGGRNRLRPVMMTTLTTILGVLPLAVTGGAGGAMNSLGRALVGGIAAGTLLTLFVVPLAYLLIDDLRRWSANYFGSLLRLGGVR